MSRLTRQEWTALAHSHRERVEAELADVSYRRVRGLRHPVDDFLFHYYNLRPSHLAQWHPGVGVVLADAPEFVALPFYLPGPDAVFDAPGFVAKRRGTIGTAGRLLAASAAAAPRFDCFGMHEWAMVYRLGPGETRHPYLKLRFEPEELAQVVDDTGCRCTHFDAFRFFTAPAKPLNLLEPTRQRQAELDQPGCLHVNMDLYKWAGKLSPAVPTELLFETFLLARQIREVDMAASAYDLTDWGIAPIRVETPTGRAEYAALQRDFHRRAAPLRSRLLGWVDKLLAEAGNPAMG